MGIDLNSAPDHFKRCLPEQERKALGKHGMTKEEAIEAYEYNTEKELQDVVLRWLEMHGIYTISSRMDKPTTIRPGTPDFICCVDGIALFIECKRKDGRLSPAQVLEHKTIQSSKGRVITAYTLKDVIKEVRNIQAEQRYESELLYRNGWKRK